MVAILYSYRKRGLLSKEYLMELHSFVTLFVVLFGLIIGSFLNVVIYRLPRDQSLVRPGSHCPGCQAPVRWYQNIPLLSYLALRGRCGVCATRIHWQYPLVEFVTALLFWCSWRGIDLSLFGVISQFRIWCFIAICVSVFFIDLEHRIIPDELSIGGWAIGLLTAYFDFRLGIVHLVLASIAGFGFFFSFALLYEKFTGRVGLGGGDIKFMGTIGIFLGFGGIWSSLMISSVIGSVVGVGYAAWQRRKDALKPEKIGEETHLLRASIPYGPFLVTGALVELFFEVSQWMSG
jgi:leader peptidase (prepilin peptidase)/N-methyltransferase